VIRLTLTLSAALLAGILWQHFDALKRVRSSAWQQGAEFICEQVAQGKPSRVVGEVCEIEIAGVWLGHPGVVRRVKP